MSLILQNPLFNSTYRTKHYFLNNTAQFYPIRNPKFSLVHNPFQTLENNGYPFQKNFYQPRHRLSHIRAHDSSINALQEHKRSTKLFNFDVFLSLLESLCVVSSVVISLGCIVNWVFFRQLNSGLVLLGNRVLVWLLAGAVAVGSLIRRRQWSRVCGSPTNSIPGSENGNVIERIEKLEESTRSATTIIRMLSRQLEKLGIRFRVTRKALKDPITEAAALAQKNSEATRALAMQEDILEKELAEVQKVLLAMQDQQQKQLELILAIAKSGKLFETKRAPSQGPGKHETGSADNGLRQMDGQQIEAMARQKGTTNDKAL